MPERNDTECGRFGGVLQPGYSVDSTFGALLPQVWIPGKPTLGMGGALKMPSITVRRGLRLEAWRCATCTRVEWFAKEKAAR